MSSIDIVGDLGIRLKNGSKRYLKSIKVYNTKYVKSILDCLESLGYIFGYVVLNDKYLEVYLKYKSNMPVIKDVKRVSKLSKRLYWSYKDLLYYKEKNILIIYTSNQGVLSTLSLTFEIEKIGGEPLLMIK